MNVTNQTELLFQKKTPDGLIEIWNENKLRWLNINNIEQTRINTEHPEQLESSVHRYFLACLLFIETPKKVLLGGLGGGALARYLHNKKPEIQGDAVEINETIAKLSEDYFYFPKNQWNIVVDDLQQWNNSQYDLMVVDIAEGDLTPAWLTSEKMLSQLKRQLSKRGVLAIDLLVADAPSFSQQLTAIRKVFKRQTLCTGIPGHKNIIVFAFNQQPENTSMNELKNRVETLTALWGLEFSTLLEQLVKDNPKENGIF